MKIKTIKNSLNYLIYLHGDINQSVEYPLHNVLDMDWMIGIEVTKYPANVINPTIKCFKTEIFLLKRALNITFISVDFQANHSVTFIKTDPHVSPNIHFLDVNSNSRNVTIVSMKNYQQIKNQKKTTT